MDQLDMSQKQLEETEARALKAEEEGNLYVTLKCVAILKFHLCEMFFMSYIFSIILKLVFKLMLKYDSIQQILKFVNTFLKFYKLPGKK